jgi:hypothetical protein
MAKLAIYMNEAGKSVVHHTGFSWVAAIFPYIWAFQHRLYKTCVATFAINALLAVMFTLVPDGAPRAGATIGCWVLQLIGAGFGASLYYRVMLEHSGYFMTSAEPSRLNGS